MLPQMIHFVILGLLGFAKLRSGDQYEIVLRLGSQKWRMKGAVKSFNDQTWDNTHSNMQPLLSEIINVKVRYNYKQRIFDPRLA